LRVEEAKIAIDNIHGDAVIKIRSDRLIPKRAYHIAIGCCAPALLLVCCRDSRARIAGAFAEISDRFCVTPIRHERLIDVAYPAAR
jgi:hypothetical protein